MERSAVIDSTGHYRYLLTRRWSDEKPLCWIMLNPSTADAEKDDNTIKRCIQFAETLGYMTCRYGGIEVVNLFAYRAREPRQLLTVPDPVGPDNDRYIQEAAERCEKIVAAWGTTNWQLTRPRMEQVAALLSRWPIYCVAATKDGVPRHPLYAKGVDRLEIWRPALR